MKPQTWFTSLAMLAIAGVGLLTSVGGAQAGPLIFTTASYDTNATALTGSTADADFDATPASALPLVSTATAVAPNDFATAFGLASSGLLSTSAEADGFAGAVFASATGTAHFVGTFSGTGPLTLNLDFDSLTSVLGGASSSGTLFVLLRSTLGSTTTTLFDNLFTVGDDITLNFPALGDLNTLELLLVSEATTLGSGQSGQNFSQLVFAGTIEAAAVPEPGTIALAGLALLGLAATRRRPHIRAGLRQGCCRL